MKKILPLVVALLAGTASAEWTTITERSGEASSGLVKSFSDLAKISINKSCIKGTYIFSYNDELILDNRNISVDTLIGIVLSSYSKEGQKINYYEYDRDENNFEVHFVSKSGIGTFMRISITEGSDGASLARQECLV